MKTMIWDQDGMRPGPTDEGLPDEEINRFLAEKCGWGHGNEHYCRFTVSLDALLAPGGPVEKCRERGLGYSLLETRDGYTYAIVDTGNLTKIAGRAGASSPARALAEACYLALKGGDAN